MNSGALGNSARAHAHINIDTAEEQNTDTLVNSVMPFRCIHSTHALQLY